MLPQYRLLRPTFEDYSDSAADRLREARRWRSLYVDDYWKNIAAGQMHAHKDTCFKHVAGKGVRFARHCRFNFCHFVTLCLQCDDGVRKQLRNHIRKDRQGVGVAEAAGRRAGKRSA